MNNLIREHICEIPVGWYRLYYQMCDDLEKVVTEDFDFIQVKEKFNRMTCYYIGHNPKVDKIIQKYEYLSRRVCTICGRPATFETRDYIASYCNDCWKDYHRHEGGNWLPEIKLENTIVSMSTEGVSSTTYSVADEWQRYLKEINFNEAI